MKVQGRGTVSKVIGILLAVFLVQGCSKPSGEGSGSRGTGKVRAVVTVGMVADLVRTIGGESVEVKQLMGSGVDPHLYRPTRDDTLAVRDAEIVFYCGLKLEGKMSDLLAKTADTRSSVAVTIGLPQEKIMKPDDGDHADPHVWMDVSLWKLTIDPILKTLIALRPSEEGAMRERAEQLRARLDELDRLGEEVIGSIPQGKRVLITSHDAFQYFGRRYGIEVAGIQGISTDSEAGLRRIRELVDQIVERKIEAVFIESSVPQDSVQALVRGAADRGHGVKIGGPLYSDAMGESGTDEGTYEGMMVHNFTTIARFLGGTVPDSGFSGKKP